MKLRFFHDRKAGSEYIQFIGVIVVLMLVVFNIVPPINTAWMFSKLNQIHRETLLRMETTGGLSPALEQRVLDKLEEEGFDINHVSIIGTPAVADYGTTIELVIRYAYTYEDYAFSNFLITRTDTMRTMTASGSTVSFTFDK